MNKNELLALAERCDGKTHFSAEDTAILRRVDGIVLEQWMTNPPTPNGFCRLLGENKTVPVAAALRSLAQKDATP